MVAATIISAVALRARALSAGGAVAATGVGGALVAGAGRRGAIALLAFFLSSTLLGRLPARLQLDQRRGNQRDAVQVIANGGVAAALALAAAIAPEDLRSLLLIGSNGAIATATADTWATEIGFRARQSPRSIVTGRTVPPGTSGGVTLAGLAAAIAGSFAIAGIASSGPSTERVSTSTPLTSVALAGITGSIVDSVLGASIQQVRLCPTCTVESELLVHRCGTPTELLRGAPWCSNDVVNALSTAIGATTAMALTARRCIRAR